MKVCGSVIHGWTWTLLLAAGVSTAFAEPAAETADRLTRRWAPIYVQHVASDDGGADRPTRIDFDGNWDARDNWVNQAAFGTALPPAAYSAAILTTTHAYLTYTLFYPRDWTSFCISLVCHDNDLETVQLVVARDVPDGRLLAMKTKAHHAISERDASEIALSEDGRPVLRVEEKGHGISVCRPGEEACEPRPGRILYAPSVVASAPPVRALGQRVGYELLSLHDTLWARRHRSRDDLWLDGETGPLYYTNTRFGRLGLPLGASMDGTEYAGGVRPPWALAGARGARGDWFLDPAVAHGALDTHYVYNPFLDDLAAECTGARCSAAPPLPSRAGYFAKLGFKRGAPYIVLALGAVLMTSWLRPRA